MKPTITNSLPHLTSPKIREEQRNSKISPPILGGARGDKFGFTLVELIVVISILAILGTIAFLSFGGFSSKARDGSRISDTVSLSKGLELYQVKSGTYPRPEGTTMSGIINGTVVAYKGEIQDQISSLTKISKTPKDPLSNNYYIYGTTLDYKQYQIATTLENSLSFQEGIGEKVYADGPSYQAKVTGNYKGLIKFTASGTTDTWIANIPSLIYDNGANLISTGTYYSTNKNTNLPYKIKDAITNNKTADILIKEIVNTSATLIGVKIESLTQTGITEQFTGALLASFGGDISRLINMILGTSTASNNILKEEISVPTLPISTIAVGYNHVCSIRTTGKLYCWGSNSNGQLGDGTVNTRTTPIAIDTTNTYINISSRNDYTCGIRSNNKLYCWGDNTFGKLGDGTTIQKTTPTPIDITNNYSFIKTGYFHTCGIRTDGKLYCWGSNSYGQLGDGTTIQKTTPTPIDETNKYITVDTGRGHTCGIRADGKLYCWGSNSYGQLGDGTLINKSIITAIDSLNTYINIVVGDYYTCGIRTDGKLYCWGWNSYGQLGDGTTSDKLTFVPTNTTDIYTNIIAGWDHTCGIRADGKLYCWGSNSKGQLGNGNTTNKLAPISIDSTNTYKSIMTGGYQTCGIRTDGKLYCWGWNWFYQLGDGTTTDRYSPIPVDSTGIY